MKKTVLLLALMSLNAFAQQIMNKAQFHPCSTITKKEATQLGDWNKPLPTGLTGRVLYVSATDDTLLLVSSEYISAKILMSVFNSNTGKWSVPARAAFYDKVQDNECHITKKGRELFFSLKSKNGDLDLYSFLYSNGECSNPCRLNDNINTAYNEKSACLSEDGNTLYFSSDRKGGKGGYDIYRSEKRSDGEWGPAQNLGGSVNTKADEDAPFILADDVTLYFNSKGYGSAGGYNIFTSTMNEDGVWSLPESVGKNINSGADEQYAYLTSDEKILYFSSFTNGLNIFEYVIYQPEFTENKRQAVY